MSDTFGETQTAVRHERCAASMQKEQDNVGVGSTNFRLNWKLLPLSYLTDKGYRSARGWHPHRLRAVPMGAPMPVVACQCLAQRSTLSLSA